MKKMESLKNLKEKEISFETQKRIIGGDGETLKPISEETGANPPYHCGDRRHGMKYDNGKEMYSYLTFQDCPKTDTIQP